VLYTLIDGSLIPQLYESTTELTGHCLQSIKRSLPEALRGKPIRIVGEHVMGGTRIFVCGGAVYGYDPESGVFSAGLDEDDLVYREGDVATIFFCFFA